MVKIILNFSKVVFRERIGHFSFPEAGKNFYRFLGFANIKLPRFSLEYMRTMPNLYSNYFLRCFGNKNFFF